MTMTTTTEDRLTHAEQNAQGWRDAITAANEAYEFCLEEGEGKHLSREAKACLKAHFYDGTNHTELLELIEEAMREAALSVDIRDGWRSPGDRGSVEPTEFQILLTTGGPALRIIGELNDGDASRCWMEYQDWGTPWTRCFAKHEREVESLRWFCGLFWFGE